MLRSISRARRIVRLIFVKSLVLLVLLVPVAPVHANDVEHARQMPLRERPSAPATPVVPPLSFAPLPGVHQAGPRYEAQGLSGRFVFDRTGYTLETGSTDPRTAYHDSIGGPEATGVRLQFEGETHARLAPRQLLPGVVNDLRGSDPTAWRTGIPTFGVLSYRQLYDGIDLEYEGLPGRFKSTYYIAPGADAKQIRWRFTGATSVEVDRETGELWVELPAGGEEASYLIEGAPLAWQEFGARRVIVRARFEIDAEGGIGYALGSYDPERPLIIDPFMSYAVVAGGSSADEVRALAVDGD